MNLAHFSDTSLLGDSLLSDVTGPAAPRTGAPVKWMTALLLGVLAANGELPAGEVFAAEARPLLTRQRISLPGSQIALSAKASKSTLVDRRVGRRKNLKATGPTARTVPEVLPSQAARPARVKKRSTPLAPKPGRVKSNRVQNTGVKANRVQANRITATPTKVGAARGEQFSLPIGPVRKIQVKAPRADSAIFSLPPALLKPRMVPSLLQSTPTFKLQTINKTVAALPEMGKGSKIVHVKGLKLPPASAPLPAWMRDKVLPLDGKFIASPLPSDPKTRVAQNPGAPPVRQPQSPITSSDRLPNQIEVAASTYIVLVTKVDLQTVAIADPNIADVTVVNARALLVNGKSAGITTLVVVDRLGVIRQYQVRVVSAPGERPNDISELIGIEGVSVQQVRDTLIVTGEVETAEEMKRVLDLAGIFSAKVINQLSVRGKVDPDAVTSLQIQEAIGRPEVSVRVVGKTAIIDGVVGSEQERQRAEQITRAFSAEVLNLLRLPTISVCLLYTSPSPRDS